WRGRTRAIVTTKPSTGPSPNTTLETNSEGTITTSKNLCERPLRAPICRGRCTGDPASACPEAQAHAVCPCQRGRRLRHGAVSGLALASAHGGTVWVLKPHRDRQLAPYLPL